MPIKYVKTCNTCQFIKKEARKKLPQGTYLVDRIYKSRAWQKSGQSLKSLQLEYGTASYNAFVRHCKNHQAPTQDQLDIAAIDRIMAPTEEIIARRVIKTENVRQAVMDKAMAELEAGNMKFRPADLLKAAKDQDDVEAKKKDQGLQLMAMVQAFAAGELKAPDRDNSIEGEILG